jgi:hypothetical protein
MFESVILLVLIALFAFGYGTRSYVGVLVPGVLFVCAVILDGRALRPATG